MTAVEKLVQEINKLTGLTIAMDEPCVEQALSMEKEQKGYSEEDMKKVLLIKHDGLSVDYVMQIVKSTKSE